MSKTFSLAQLAEKFDLTYRGNPEAAISAVATLENAQEGQLSFLFNPLYKKFLKTTKASIVIVDSKCAELCADSMNLLISDSPYYSYAQVAELFTTNRNVGAGIHKTAVIGEGCQIDPTANIAAHVVIGDRVTIAADVSIGANVVIQNDVSIGSSTIVWPNVTLCDQTIIGEACEIFSGAVIGSDGFGYAMHQGAWHKVPQLGRVILGNRVSVGSNTSIDRGSSDDTIISDGVKLDNQIQIAHNVKIGEHTVAAGCVGIAGSTKVGKYCQLGGGAGLTGHIELTDNVMVSGMSMIPKSITEPGVYSGRDLGLMPLKEWQKNIVQLRQINKLVDRVKQLESKQAQVKKTGSSSSNNQQETTSMKTQLDINEIIQLIPHRYPFLLVDRVLEYELGKSLVAIKNVTANEAFFVGHFPQRPVMPGVLIVEALAQAGAVLAFKTAQEWHPEDDAEILFLAGVDKTRFKRVVEPGDQLRLEVSVLKAKGKIWKLQGNAYVNDELACSAEILSAK